MDDIDRAQEQEHLTRVAAIAAAQHRAPVKTPDNGRCVECGERIEPARVRALGDVDIGTRSMSDAITAVDRIIEGPARSRARMIVQTELGRIHSAATQAGMEEAAKRIPMKKEWMRSGRKHPRPEHQAAHGQVRAVDEPFDVGGEKLMYPRDPNGSAKNTINCGCRHRPKVDVDAWVNMEDLPPAPVATNPTTPVMQHQPHVPVAGVAQGGITPPNIVSSPGGILAQMEPTPSTYRAVWPADFPAITLHAAERTVKSHPDYAAAKAGDFDHAARLIEALINTEAIDTLVRQHRATRPLLVPVWAEESDGKNIIPLALAQYISTVTGWGWDDSIIQANRVRRTGKDGYYRLAVQPLFDGRVQAGAAYLMVDDFLGQGATLANLRGYIQRRGGRVVGGTALTGKPESAILALSLATLAQLRAIHGTDLEYWWRERFGFGFEQLTESEARYLIARTDADRIRAEILARLGQGG